LRAAGSFPREKAIAANGQDAGIEIVPVLNGSANPEIGVPEVFDPGTKSLRRSTSLADIAFIVATVMFFVVAIFYLRGCERLK
jgi:hypothetical protein